MACYSAPPPPDVSLVARAPRNNIPPLAGDRSFRGTTPTLLLSHNGLMRQVLVGHSMKPHLMRSSVTTACGRGLETSVGKKGLEPAGADSSTEPCGGQRGRLLLELGFGGHVP